MIKSIMCIGCACEGHLLTGILSLREKGPVDNVRGSNFYNTLSLFNAQFEIQVKNFQCRKHPVLYVNNLPFGYELPCGFDFVHNDFADPSFRQKVIKRIDEFHLYCSRATTDPSLYFLYTPNDGDYRLTSTDIEAIKSQLPSFILDRLFVFQTRPLGDLFSDFFPTLKYPDSLDTFFHHPDEVRTNLLFSEFMHQNSEFFGLI